MTEFAIAAAFVLIPLFVIIPVLGKYSDMKYASIQAARYQAWEYTANYIDLNDQPTGFTAVSQSNKPLKSIKQVRAESERRFYSSPDTVLSSAQDRLGYFAADANLLWSYHDGSPMYKPAVTDTNSILQPSEPTPDPTKVFSGVIRVADKIFGFIAGVLGAINAGAGFDALNGNGYSKSSVYLTVEKPPAYRDLNDKFGATPLFLADQTIRMHAKAGVLSDGWSAGGGDHTVYQAKGLVPTAMLDVLLNPGGFPLQDIAATILLSPELSRSSLRFGYMEKDTIHPSKLSGGGSHSCPGGYCRFD